MHNHNVTPPEHSAQALGWLDLLATLMPETIRVDFEFSSWVLIVAVVALWIWRRPPGGRRHE